MIWAGAKADTPISNNGFEDETALESAARAEHLESVKAMQPAKYPHMLAKMMSHVHGSDDEGVGKYLRSLGAPINDRDDGSSSQVMSALLQLSWDVEPRSVFGYKDSSTIEKSISRIEELLAGGAKMPPNDERHIRRLIKDLSQDQMLRLVKAFRKHKAFPDEVLRKVISTPKFRQILGNKWDEARLRRRTGGGHYYRFAERVCDELKNKRGLRLKV